MNGIIDFDLAAAYGIETKALKQAVKRNIQRFEGDDFMFIPTKDELLRSQIVTLNMGRGQHIKYLPYAFTELGVAMLSSVLNSATAIEINRGIMRTFVAIRHELANPISHTVNELRNDMVALRAYIDECFADYNDINEDTRVQIELINEALAELQVKRLNERSKRPIGFRNED